MRPGTWNKSGLNWWTTGKGNNWRRGGTGSKDGATQMAPLVEESWTNHRLVLCGQRLPGQYLPAVSLRQGKKLVVISVKQSCVWNWNFVRFMERSVFLLHSIANNSCDVKRSTKTSKNFCSEKVLNIKSVIAISPRSINQLKDIW